MPVSSVSKWAWRSLRVSILPLVLWTLGAAALADDAASSAWPDWDRFVERFVQADGRVIDVTFEGKTTSEGQSYGLFFALVANRPDQFQTLLKWTSDNLADGELGDKLPGWLWGKRDDGSWGLKDRNAASDADLWIAYSLLEAARLWSEPRYEKLGRKLLAQISEQEIARAGAAGTLLLPGPVGFKLAQQRYRINPSYLPGFMFTYFAAVDKKGPWAATWESYARLAPKIFAAGVAPDIVIVDSKGVVLPDTERAPAGSYDAIRVYLWAGMSGEDSKPILRLLTPFAKVVRTTGAPPEKMDPANGKVLKADYSPIGFTGAVLPFLETVRDRDAMDSQRAKLQKHFGEVQAGLTTHYYDQVLILFGKGWLDGYYRFDQQGRLQTKWSK